MSTIHDVRQPAGIDLVTASAELWAWWAALAVLSAVLAAPLLIAEVPPVLDYPNHLARLVLLAAGPDDPVLGRIFTPSWSIIPNLAGDLIGLVLLHLLPVHVAGRCLLASALLLNLTGVVALHRALFGRRSFWPLASVLVAYNSGFLLGFLNFQFGAGLAMLCAAAWLTWRESRPAATIAGAAAVSILLFFCHLMGLVFFLVLIGSAEMRALRDFRAVILRSAGLLAVLAGPVLLSAFTTIHNAPTAAQWPRWDVKLVNAASPFINYVFPLDMISAALVYGGIVLGVAAGWLVVAPRAALAAAVLPAAYFVLPFDLMSASFLDMRVAVICGFLAFAVVDPVRPRSTGYRLAAAGCVMLFTVRMAVVAEVWSEHRRDLAELRAAIADVPPAAVVYVTSVPQEEAPAYWDTGPRARRLSNGLRTDYHLPALLLIERGAFWPGLFANPAQQPIRLRPEYARLAHEAHDIPAHASLVADPDSALPALRDFDFVLMLEAGADANLTGFVPRCLALRSRSDFAALFRVRPECAPAQPVGSNRSTDAGPK
jgi:hypothetical protein